MVLFFQCLACLALLFSLPASAAPPTPPAGLSVLSSHSVVPDDGVHAVPVPAGAAVWCVVRTLDQPHPEGADQVTGYCALWEGSGSSFERTVESSRRWFCTDPPDCNAYGSEVLPSVEVLTWYGAPSSASPAASGALTEAAFVREVDTLRSLGFVAAGALLIGLFGFGYSVGRSG